MKIEEIRELIKTEDYNFLRDNEHLGGNICLLTLGGSHAYGTNVEGSDLDIRGVALNKPQDLIGLSNFDSVVDNTTDTTIYSFNNLIKLLLNVNPNIIEMLGCRDEHYLYITKQGQMIRDNVDLFLTQKCINSFGGYANSQLRRLQNALARDKYNANDKEKHIYGSIINQMNGFNERYKEFEGENSMNIYLDKSLKQEYDEEIHIDINLKKYPLRDLRGMMSEMQEVVKNYGKLNHRNKKKDDLHLNKHYMHLIRLYIMAIELLEGKGVNTYRENDRKFLLDIRNGKFQREDGTYRQEAFELIDDLQQKMNYAKENSPLPKKPNMKKVEEFVMEVNRSVINGKS